MPTCDTGWTQEGQLPSAPAGVFHTSPPNLWERVSYEWEPANDGPRQTMACGHTGQFNYYFELGESASIDVGFSDKVSVSGGVSYTTTVGSGNQVNVGAPGFEFIGTPIVLKMTRESGTYTTSGGFGINVFKAAWRFFWYGPAGLLPSIVYTTDKTESIFLRCGWMICKKACG